MVKFSKDNKSTYYIYIDVDGVMVNFIRQWVKFYKEDTGIAVDYASIVDYDIEKWMPTNPPFKYLHDETFYTNIEFMPGAIWGVNTLQALGFNITFLTACLTLESIVGKYKCLEQAFSWFNAYRNFAVMSRKEHIQANNTILIEDKPSLLTKSQYTYTIGIEHPYNKQVAELVDLYTKDWTEIVKFVKDLPLAKFATLS